MELRHLRYFVAVAEELHFTRAAGRVGISQPPLSQQIRDLERHVGTALLDRRAKSVELTAAGKVFLDDAKAILRAAASARANALRAANGQIGSLRVGFTGSTAFHPLVPTTIRLYRRACPDVVLTLREANSLQLRQELEDRLIDVAFLRGAASLPGAILTQELDTEPLVMVFPVPPGEATMAPAPLSSYADQPFVLFPRENGPELYDAIFAACRAAGFEPVPEQHVPQLASMINLVAAGMGVSLVPISMAQVKVQGVGYRPIAGDPPRARLTLARRAEDRSETLREFVALARTQAALRPRLRALSIDCDGDSIVG